MKVLQSRARDALQLQLTEAQTAVQWGLTTLPGAVGQPAGRASDPNASPSAKKAAPPSGPMNALESSPYCDV